jgi:lysophospholipid acyltransferase (LPLAT)-like uncharacterized protein
LNSIAERLKKQWKRVRSFFFAKAANHLLSLLMKTCRIEIEGLQPFIELVSREKCILMLWHNRLAPALFIFSRYTPHIRFTALVSGSQDGSILSNIIQAYKNGGTIRAPHLARYQALREVVRTIDEGKQVVVITPDGPRGPCYEMKPGIVIAALDTGANVVAFNWESEKYWELKTWDRFRIPKPFSKIVVTLSSPVVLNQNPKPSLEEAMALLKKQLPDNPRNGS